MSEQDNEEYELYQINEREWKALKVCLLYIYVNKIKIENTLIEEFLND